MRSKINRRDFTSGGIALASLIAAGEAGLGCGSTASSAAGSGTDSGTGGGGSDSGNGPIEDSSGNGGADAGPSDASTGGDTGPWADGGASDGADAGTYYHGDIKVACNAYCFNQIMLNQLAGGPDTMDLMQLLDWCANPLHKFDALDATGYYFPPGNFAMPTAQYLSDFKTKANNLGIVISGTGIGNDFASPDPTVRANGVAIFKRWCNVANAIGAPIIRVFAGPMPAGYTWNQVLQWVVDSLAQCAVAAKAAGLKAALQNHDDFLSTSDQVIQVLGMINMPDAIGANDDIGSFDDGGAMGIDAKYAAIARILPYAINMQVKTSITPPSQAPPYTPTDLLRLMRVIRNSPFRGYVPIEVLAVPGVTYDPFTQVPMFLQAVRNAIAMTAAG
jgi:hypothetical protein